MDLSPIRTVIVSQGDVSDFHHIQGVVGDLIAVQIQDVGVFLSPLGLGTVHIRTGTSTGIGTWNSVPVPNGTFFRYFTLFVITKTFISVKK